ncbi:MAG: undecaprenyl diphosphate synthase family protein [Chlamydiae bacterium]|nr:undecaprenyl diphosphate synthase family protein [Chlamydiota bacterium]
MTKKLPIIKIPSLKRLPKHIGIIPDGNRRWAELNGLAKHDGYKHGIEPGIKLFDICLKLGIREITIYGFTQDNTKRPAAQTLAFRQACVDAVLGLAQKDADILVVGDFLSSSFPKKLIPFTKRGKSKKGSIKVNFLVNYGWNWDLNHAYTNKSNKKFINKIASCEISRIDLIIRWGGRRRLSGFLPIQSIYADFYVIDEMWPEFKPEHVFEALKWYQDQDITLGG